MGGKTSHSYARFSGWNEGLLSPNVCVRKIIVGSDVVDGHLDTCATHCFVSYHRSTLLQEKGYPPIKIKPFPIGQGARLPDATTAHLAPLRLVTKDGQIVGFGTVLFLVSNTGGDILIANNILDFLGILRYHPPFGYEQILQEEARLSFISPEKRAPPGDIKQEILQAMLKRGQCLFTESTLTELAVPLPPFKIQEYKATDQIKEDKGYKCQLCGKHKERCKCETPSKFPSKQGEPESDLGKGASRANR